MILIDFTQTIIAGLMAQLKSNDNEINENMLRHMILNSLRNYQKKYAGDYGDIVLCTDAANPWRRENFPYRYMYVERCEADDIIAVLSKVIKEDVLIISGDKDFQQLQKYDNITQWSPNLNRMIDCVQPEEFLKEHVLKGDTSDGIPNILSNDNCFDEGIRQTPLRKPILEKYLRISMEKDDKYYRNYLRNQTLIDFEFIPEDIENAILSEFEKTEPVHGRVLDYLTKHRLNQLIDNAGDFTL